MNKLALAVLLTVLCTVGSAQTPQGDEWLVVSLDVVKTTDLVPREKIDFVTDPKFWPLWDINGEVSKMQKFMLGLDSATSDDKLEALRGLLGKPTQLQLTVSHHRSLYRGWCLGSSEQILGDFVKDLQSKLREPCGQLLASYVGKTLPTWPLKSATPNLDGWFVGVKVEREFLRFLAVQDPNKSYEEVYVIW